MSISVQVDKDEFEFLVKKTRLGPFPLPPLPFYFKICISIFFDMTNK